MTEESVNNRYEELKEQYQRENWDMLGDGVAQIEVRHKIAELSFHVPFHIAKLRSYRENVRGRPGGFYAYNNKLEVLTYRDNDIEVVTVWHFHLQLSRERIDYNKVSERLLREYEMNKIVYWDGVRQPDRHPPFPSLPHFVDWSFLPTSTYGVHVRIVFLQGDRQLSLEISGGTWRSG